MVRRKLLDWQGNWTAVVVIQVRTQANTLGDCADFSMGLDSVSAEPQDIHHLT
jgi:hypothetical protein